MDHPSAPAHWQLSKDPSGTPRSGSQPLLSQNTHQHQSHHCQPPPSSLPSLDPFLSTSDPVLSTSTRPPPSSPQAPNNSTILLPRADQFKLVPPSSQPPLENDLGRPINLDKAPPPSSQPPQPLTRLFLLSSASPSTEESTGFFFWVADNLHATKPPSQPALPSSLPQPPPHQIDRNRVEVILFGLPYSPTSLDRPRLTESILSPLHPPAFGKRPWVDLSTLIAGLIPQPPPSSVVSPSVGRPATLLTLD
ncbi:hypothetical protein PGT21_011002 [Puccinia graminis f. sp. tritici]|uniref:Uncharacterized protein n=1 Tax=Puccinia graminis f. sp. tritici TaxID=56615 RepID=A0A5B0N3K8_PUCGR|nr:hypothetical protein PGT21_011002 [Puccinia graminis f. sp. tritici]